MKSLHSSQATHSEGILWARKQAVATRLILLVIVGALTVSLAPTFGQSKKKKKGGDGSTPGVDSFRPFLSFFD